MNTYFNLLWSVVFYALLGNMPVAAQPVFDWAKENAISGSSAVAVDAGGNVYNLGMSGSSTVYITKADSSGTFLWSKQLPGVYSYLSGLAVINGGVYITGTFQGTIDFDPDTGISNLTSVCNVFTNGNPQRNAFILRLDGCGSFMWVKLLAEKGCVTNAFSITADAAGNVYTTGKYIGPADFDPGTGIYNLTEGTGYACKLDPAGNFVWASGFGNYESVSIAVDKDGNVLTTGSYIGSADFDPSSGSHTLSAAGGTQDIFVLKLDTAGNFLWAASMGGATGSSGTYDRGSSITTDLAGNVYLTGDFKTTDADFDPGPGVYTMATNGNQDFFVCKLTSSGDFSWAHHFGTAGDENGTAIAVDGCGNVYTFGNLPAGTADLDPGSGVHNLTSSQGGLFISELDSAGNYVSAGFSARVISGSASMAWKIAVDCSGYIYTSGRLNGTIDVDPGPGTISLSGTGMYISKLLSESGSCSSCSGIIIPCGTSPVAAFVSSDTVLCANDCINFTDLSVNATSWQWSFDGASPSSSNSQNPQHICYTNAGVYNVTLIASGSGGTDTVKLSNFITVMAAPPTPTITQSKDTLFCSFDPSYTSYQWYDTTALISGATNSFYVAQHNGNYNVQVANENGCQTAVGINVVITGISTVQSEQEVIVYPNPTKDELFVSGYWINGESTITIYDVLGKMVYNQQLETSNSRFRANIDLHGLTKGIYLLQIIAENRVYRIKVVKE